MIAGRSLAAYDPEARSWRFTDTPSVSYETGAATDPVSGRILLVSRLALGSVDPATGAYTRHVDVAEPDLATGDGISLVYFPPTDRFYAFAMTPADRARAGVWEVTFDRANPAASSVRRLTGVAPPQRPIGAEAWAYDDANELIGGGVTDGAFFAFDPVAQRWHERVIDASTAALPVGSVDGHALVYDPVDNVYVFRTNIPSQLHTWAYRWGGQAPAAPGDAGANALDAGGDATMDARGGCGCHATAGGTGIGLEGLLCLLLLRGRPRRRCVTWPRRTWRRRRDR